MPNNLTTEKIRSIRVLYEAGFSLRQIASVLAVDRKTVRRHLSLEVDGTNDSEETPAIPPPKIARYRRRPTGVQTECSNAKVLDYLKAGLNIKQIYLKLVQDHGFTGSYWTVNRLVRRIRTSQTQPTRSDSDSTPSTGGNERPNTQTIE